MTPPTTARRNHGRVVLCIVLWLALASSITLEQGQQAAAQWGSAAALIVIGFVVLLAAGRVAFIPLRAPGGGCTAGPRGGSDEATDKGSRRRGRAGRGGGRVPGDRPGHRHRPEPTPSSAPVTSAESAAPIALPGTVDLGADRRLTTHLQSLTTQPAPARQSALATMVLSSGAPVNPRVDRTPRTARPASTPRVTGALTPPPDNPDPQVFQDPAAVATAWLSALCWYDYRAGRDDNTRRAAALRQTSTCRRVRTHGRSTTRPGPRSPQPKRVPPAPTSPPPWKRCPTTAATRRRSTSSATQVLSAAGTAYQSTPITLTRILQRDPARALGDRPAGDGELSIKRKATKIVLRWAIGGAAGMLLSWPVLLGLVLLLLVVIILSSAGGPAALAPPALAASNYSCTIAPPQHQPPRTAGSAAVTPAARAPPATTPASP